MRQHILSYSPIFLHSKTLERRLWARSDYHIISFSMFVTFKIEFFYNKYFVSILSFVMAWLITHSYSSSDIIIDIFDKRI